MQALVGVGVPGQVGIAGDLPSPTGRWPSGRRAPLDRPTGQRASVDLEDRAAAHTAPPPVGWQRVLLDHAAWRARLDVLGR